MAGNDEKFSVDLELLAESIDAMTKFGAAVDTWLAEVDRHIKDLHMSWTSTAADAQQAAHGKWVSGVGEMRENLADLRKVAERAHANYSNAVDTNTRMWP
ncbi:WXG100 family type VII secretion target [Nocardia macrotermitis]|uniref:ESAT-6-like protein n=1 Tax=Nocardia macrotermitis TaxID=2585198 RepID=A0A7K0D9A7_9NOCA|nr:WXG100 family type VII secretion target [Nocardia macrotermitis]MQY22288.1 ESAT-6-like protein EsxE [Nocardia macrotermitis]